VKRKTKSGIAGALKSKSLSVDQLVRIRTILTKLQKNTALAEAAGIRDLSQGHNKVYRETTRR
jgi:hypothetical protein